MANKKPVLGVVSCTVTGCSGEMVVRSRNAGRGGGTKKYGHCKKCGHLEQKNDMQAHLGTYRQDNPVSEPEAAPVVKEAAAFKGNTDEFDPVEIKHIPVSDTPKPQPAKASGGGAFKWVVGVIAIAGVITGVGYAVNR